MLDSGRALCKTMSRIAQGDEIVTCQCRQLLAIVARMTHSALGRLILMAVLIVAARGAAQAGGTIFIHPDGAGANAWGAARMLHHGPDSELAWDRFEHVGIYTGHMKDSLTATSHGGATTHAYGVKVVADSFGMDGERRVQSLSGFDGSIMLEAIDAGGIRTGLVNSGHICEPGTAAFVAHSPSRQNTDLIAAQVIESGVDVILSGGEKFLLPVGTEGRFGEGARKDGRNLIAAARKAGYKVVFSREELLAVDPSTTGKLLGVFAHSHTFNDWPEEMLAAAGKPTYNPEAPTLAEMMQVAVDILSRDDGKFLLVVEEEASDNFGNANNASGMLEALRRADQAVDLGLELAATLPRTMVVTAADSDAGGAQVVCHSLSQENAFDPEQALPGRMNNAAPLDGVDGFLSKPFVSAPDREGNRFQFGIAWASYIDVAGGIAAKASGANAARLPVLADNTDIYRLLYLNLFGRDLFAEDEAR